MSVKIKLKLPITDLDCLKKALKNLGLSFTENGAVLTLKDITLQPGELGFYIATSRDPMAETKIREIEHEYKILYNQKKTNLEERIKNVNMLSEAEKKQTLEEKQKMDEHNKRILDNLVKKIEERAKLKGFKIQNIKGPKNTVKLVLVRRK
nr:hypothetical protein [Candidatus Sigynarchaeota archaeon]